jgi:hypothetical protein
LRKTINPQSDAIKAHDLLDLAYFRSRDQQGALEQFKTLNEIGLQYSGLVNRLLNSDPQS